jgi:hypothetical protein
MLEKFHLADVSGRRPHELSGGQKQRGSIALALIGSPRLLLLEPTVRAVVEPLLRGALELLTDPSHPRGVRPCRARLACGSHAERMKQAMIEWRKQGESHIQKRLQRARREGDLAKEVDPGDLARYISTVLTGLEVQAANGSTKAEMTHLVDMVLRSFKWITSRKMIDRNLNCLASGLRTPVHPF